MVEPSNDLGILIHFKKYMVKYSNGLCRIWLNLHQTLSISCLTRQKWLNHLLSVFIDAFLKIRLIVKLISLTLTMFVGYQKFKIAFSGLFNSFPMNSEAWVTAVFPQVIVSNSFHWYRLKNKLFQNINLQYLQ